MDEGGSDMLIHVPAGGKSCHGVVDENLITDGMLAVQVVGLSGDMAEIALPWDFDGQLIGVSRSQIEVLEKEYVF